MSNLKNSDDRKCSIFNIERFATDDGDGIRTVVFMMGCALRCDWCSNPESQSPHAVVLFHENLCQGCGKCINICPQNAIFEDKKYGLISDQKLCNGCAKCVDACVHNARTIYGYDVTQQELMELLLKDQLYYKASGGGITFSGGEPLLQSSFILSISKELKDHSIPVLVETCGEVSRHHFDEVMGEVDTIYFDLKQIDTKLHKQYTGRGNENILENLKHVSQNFSGKLSVRYPYIPKYNEDLKSIDAMVDFVCTLPHVDELVFLPYHRLGLQKYKGMGLEYKLGDMKSLKKNALYHLLDRYKSFGIPLKIQ